MKYIGYCGFDASGHQYYFYDVTKETEKRLEFNTYEDYKEGVFTWKHYVNKSKLDKVELYYEGSTAYGRIFTIADTAKEAVEKAHEIYKKYLQHQIVEADAVLKRFFRNSIL